MWCYLRDPTFSRFDTIRSVTDTHTHRRTDTRRQHIPRLARRRAVKITDIGTPVRLNQTFTRTENTRLTL